MRQIKSLSISLFCLIITILIPWNYAKAIPVIGLNDVPYKDSIKSYLKNGNLYGRSEVEDRNLKNKIKGQSLDFTLAGLHKKKCSFALRKLALYENYAKYLDYIKTSMYDEGKKQLTFLVSHKLMPFDMTLTFKLPRINKPGVYNFIFEKSFLKGLKGQIHVSNYKNRCFIYSTAKWEGPRSPIPSLIFEFFTEALGKLALENLFRISSTY